MSNERLIPASGADLPTFVIKVAGKEIGGVHDVVSIHVTRELNRIPTARIVLLDGDPAQEDFEASGGSDFLPGNEVEILAGYEFKEKTIFKGIIVKHGIKARSYGPPVLVVECKDKAVKMTIGRKNAFFLKQKDSDVIGKLIGEYGLKKKVDATQVTHPELVQLKVTDWDFMLARADANGLVVAVHDGEVNVIAPDLGAEPVVAVLYGATMLEFEAEIDARFQYAGAAASAWDAKTQQVKEGQGKSAVTGKQGDLTEKKLAQVIGLSKLELRHGGQVTDAELKDWASAALTKSSLAKIIGRVKFKGISEVLPGKMIELGGVGKRFNGAAYISGVRHEIADGNWHVDVQFGLPADWFSQKPDVMEPPASGLLPAVTGLMIGKVSKIDADPDGEHRIQVALPLIDGNEAGLWARIATLDAGKERGTFFMPEVGDEVVLGFLNDDPRDPVVLGMMHSSKLPPPLTAEAENAKKGYVSREKMQMIYDDKDKIIEISTPAGNKITLSEKDKSITIEDQNKNKIEMSDAGITLESAKDIIIKAKGDVKIEGTKIEAKAKGDMKLEGANVGIKAQAQLKAEGAAGAEVSTSAIAVIKGSLVKIN